MKLHIQRKTLLKALENARSIIRPRCKEIPILTQVLLEVYDGSLHVVATDLETTIRQKLEARLEQGGGMCVPAALLRNLLKKLQDFTVTLELLRGSRTETYYAGKAGPQDRTVDTYTLNVRCASGLYFIHGKCRDEFPETTYLKPEGATSFSIPCKTFRDLVDEAAPFVASPDDTRPILGGIQFSRDGRQLSAASTDGRRAALVRSSCRVSAKFPSCVVPVAPCRLAAKLMPLDGDLTVQFSQDCEVVKLEFEGTVIEARTLQDGDRKFPSILKILPESWAVAIDVPRVDLIRALERLMLFNTWKDAPNFVHLEIGRNLLQLRAETPDLGQAVEEIEIAGPAEPNVNAMGFNGKYLLTVLRSLGGPTVRVRFNGPWFLTEWTDPKMPRSLRLAMPIRIKDPLPGERPVTEAREAVAS